VSRIRVEIEQLVLKGFEAADRAAMIEGLRNGLAAVLSDAASQREWAQSRRTPVMRLGRMAFEPGPAGGRKFGKQVAEAIGKGLKR